VQTQCFQVLVVRETIDESVDPFGVEMVAGQINFLEELVLEIGVYIPDGR